VLGLVLDGYEYACTTFVVIAILRRFASDELTVWWVDCISTRDWTFCWQTNLWSVNSQTGQLADWTTQTGQSLE